jgi:hypothetical protein
MMIAEWRTLTNCAALPRCLPRRFMSNIGLPLVENWAPKAWFGPYLMAMTVPYGEPQGGSRIVARPGLLPRRFCPR